MNCRCATDGFAMYNENKLLSPRFRESHWVDMKKKTFTEVNNTFISGFFQDTCGKEIFNIAEYMKQSTNDL